MQHPTKAARLILLLLLSAAVFAVVGGVAAQDTGKKVLISGRQMASSDIPTLDPSLDQDVPSNQVVSELFPGLTIANEETAKIQPGLASSWDVSADGLVYTFHILSNVPWVHYNADSGAVEEVKDDSGNVRMVSAQDFAFGIQRSLDPKTAAAYQQTLAPFIKGGVDFANSAIDATDDVRKPLIDALGIKVVDPQTLQITLPKPTIVSLSIFSLWVTFAQPQWTIDANADFWTNPENINTYGPFTLKAWAHGDGGSLTMIKNPFWKGTDTIPAPKLDEVTFEFLDLPTQDANFEAGTMDVAEVDNAQIDRIKADPVLSKDYTVLPGACTYNYAFNTQSAPFDDARVRLAFSEAIDRQSLVENVTKAGETPAGFFELPSLNAAPTVADYPGLGVKYDPTDAKMLFQQYLTEKGKQASDISPSLVYNQTSLNAALAQAVQQMWNQTLGVNVQLTSEDFGTYLNNRGTFDIFRYAWCYDYPDAHNFMFDAGWPTAFLASDPSHWSNPAYDDLVNQAFTAPTTQARKDLYAKAEQILVHDQAVDAPVYYYVTKDLTQPNVTRTHSITQREAYEKWDITK